MKRGITKRKMEEGKNEGKEGGIRKRTRMEQVNDKGRQER